MHRCCFTSVSRTQSLTKADMLRRWPGVGRPYSYMWMAGVCTTVDAHQLLAHRHAAVRLHRHRRDAVHLGPQVEQTQSSPVRASLRASGLLVVRRSTEEGEGGWPSLEADVPHGRERQGGLRAEEVRRALRPHRHGAWCSHLFGIPQLPQRHAALSFSCSNECPSHATWVAGTETGL